MSENNLSSFRNAYSLYCNTDVILTQLQGTPSTDSETSTVKNSPIHLTDSNVSKPAPNTYVQVSVADLERLEFLEKHVSTIIQYEIYKSIKSNHDGIKCDICRRRIHNYTKFNQSCE